MGGPKRRSGAGSRHDLLALGISGDTENKQQLPARVTLGEAATTGIVAFWSDAAIPVLDPLEGAREDELARYATCEPVPTRPTLGAAHSLALA